MKRPHTYTDLELFTDIQIEDGIITQRLVYDKTQEISRWICATREKSMEAALISLGWTPPKEKIYGLLERIKHNDTIFS